MTTNSSSDGRINLGGDSGVAATSKLQMPSMPKDVRKRWLIVAGVAAVGVVLAATFAAAPPPKKAVVQASPMIDTTPKGLNTQADWKSQTGAELQELKKIVSEQRATQQELLARIEALRREGGVAGAGSTAAPTASALKLDLTLPPPPPPPKRLAGEADPKATAGQGPVVSVPSPTTVAPQVTRSPARSFIPKAGSASTTGAGAAAGSVVEEELTLNDKVGLLPAASFAEASLISGVEAFTGTTAASQPQPIVIRLDQNAILANAAQYDIKGCHLLASVYGDLSSERVFGRLVTLTCVNTRDQLVLSESVEGNLIDSDGKNGIRGKIQDRQGTKLAQALLANFAEGMANAFGAAQSNTTSSLIGGLTSTTSSISGNKAAASAAYSGAKGASEMLADYYLKQAEATMPVIAVDAGRKITVLFSKSVPLKFETVAPYKNKHKPLVKVAKEVQ